MERTDTIPESDDDGGLSDLGEAKEMEIQKSQTLEELMRQDNQDKSPTAKGGLQLTTMPPVAEEPRKRHQSIMTGKTVSASSAGRDDQLLVEKMNIESGFCPKRHRLRKQVSPNRQEPFVCDYCNAFVEPGATVYTCYQKDTNCNFELCSQCYLDIRLEHGVNYKEIARWFQELPKARKQLKWSKLVFSIYLEMPSQPAPQARNNDNQTDSLLAGLTPTMHSISEDEDDPGDVYLSLGGGGNQQGNLSSLAKPTNKKAKKKPKKRKRRRGSVSSIATSTAGRDRALRTFSLSSKKQVNAFMANFIQDYIETRDYNTGGSHGGSKKNQTKFSSGGNSKSKGAKHAKLDPKVLMTYLKTDSKWVHNRLENKNWVISYKFFLSMQFIKLLNQLHYQRVNLESVVLSPYGHTMKRYDGVNPPDSVEHEWHCRLCQCECDMSTWFSPHFIYWCPLSRVLLCPAHALGGAPAQSKKFVQEISKVLLDLLRCYDTMVNESPTMMEKLFKTATQLENREDDISNSLQMADLSQAIVKKFFTSHGGPNGLSEKDVEKDVGYQNIRKHMIQCADWIFNDSKRREKYAINAETFVKTDRFKSIVLAYYWEYDEEQV